MGVVTSPLCPITTDLAGPPDLPAAQDHGADWVLRPTVERERPVSVRRERDQDRRADVTCAPGIGGVCGVEYVCHAIVALHPPLDRDPIVPLRRKERKPVAPSASPPKTSTYARVPVRGESVRLSVCFLQNNGSPVQDVPGQGVGRKKDSLPSDCSIKIQH
ncbi:hypothetical protein AAFF_G00123830 [Aldrovandia affinis]|uniref:Uncharacterized protein n=1 Tax=Aldrovandia affinis TaxID=143900 RepID=A0AAD7RRW2_9TELE|nr:hypothetical protein AAFF_G00123830 [Aldrovandia affinis]